ncbi:hypothetical protein ES288_D04G075600v1 [Gossypium darwinii]|uniref:Uncharacterized protein n=1 Tax=Gossypium darwinii TaxID=34276 RepID=A0A5D2CYM0_GOSDA|nr:hypothetical protein ES288_D04G075600v1 [Gossypium darwinii]
MAATLSASSSAPPKSSSKSRSSSSSYSSSPSSFMMKNPSSCSSKRSAFTRKCARLVKEQRARFYIMRRCVTMLICWHD